MSDDTVTKLCEIIPMHGALVRISTQPTKLRSITLIRNDFLNPWGMGMTSPRVKHASELSGDREVVQFEPAMIRGRKDQT